MLRPSRPMIRPFMSSDGSSTTVTVVSAVWLAATRWSASAINARARRRDSVRASSSCWRTLLASSWRIRSWERSSRWLFASATVRPPTRSSSPSASSFAAFRSSWSCLTCTSRSFSPCSRRSTSVCWRPSSCSAAVICSSIRAASARRSCTSVSISARSFTASSRASIWASRRIVSASRSATCTRDPLRSISSPVATAAPIDSPTSVMTAVSMPSCLQREKVDSATSVAAAHIRRRACTAAFRSWRVRSRSSRRVLPGRPLD